MGCIWILVFIFYMYRIKPSNLQNPMGMGIVVSFQYPIRVWVLVFNTRPIAIPSLFRLIYLYIFQIYLLILRFPVGPCMVWKMTVLLLLITFLLTKNLVAST